MGYTHYWSHPTIDPDAWKRLRTDIAAIIDATDVPLGNYNGDGSPLVAEYDIKFNGLRATGDDYETFALSPTSTDFDFCKTGQRPYDTVVCAVLLRASALVPGFSARSDGDWSDWSDGRRLYAKVFGEDAPRPTDLRG